MTKLTNSSSRAEWASLNWLEAQKSVADLLNQHGFMIFQEKSYDDHKRTDIFVSKDTTQLVTFGIIEVKCYQKVTRSLEKSAMRQGISYLVSQYKLIENNSRWASKDKQYFVAVIYTKDYPASFYHHTPEKYEKLIPKTLLESKLHLFSSTPNSLLQKLDHLVPVLSKQSKIDDFL